MDAIAPTITLTRAEELRPIVFGDDWRVNENDATVFHRPSKLLFRIDCPSVEEGARVPLAALSARILHVCDGAQLPATPAAPHRQGRYPCFCNLRRYRSGRPAPTLSPVPCTTSCRRHSFLDTVQKSKIYETRHDWTQLEIQRQSGDGKAPACAQIDGIARQTSGCEARTSGEVKWPRSFEQNFRVVKWIVGRGLCCRAERQRVRVGLIRGAAVKGCVRSPCVVEGDVAAD